MKKISLYILVVLSLRAGQVELPQVRELPQSIVNLYRIVSGIALLAKVGWTGATSVAQGTWNTGKFMYDYPVTACVVSLSNLFIAYKLYKELPGISRELASQKAALSSQFSNMWQEIRARAQMMQ